MRARTGGVGRDELILFMRIDKESEAESRFL